MAKDIYHDQVRQALIKDGWTITDDPYPIKTEDFDWEVDLGAEKLFAAEKQNRKIVVEIKSFIEESTVYAYHRAVGQYINYRVGLKYQAPERILFLAVPVDIYESFFHLKIIEATFKSIDMKIVVFDPLENKITSWIE